MNPGLASLRPYPFERLRALLEGTAPPARLAPIDCSIGEPRHAPPAFLLQALAAALPSLGTYPATRGTDLLREAIAAWLGRRYALPRVDPATQVLPVAGSREALFAFAQAVIDPGRDPAVVLPNPGYQIYEGAALLAGARVLALPLEEERRWRMPLERLSASQWQRVALVYTCSPGNPAGQVMSLDDWKELFELSDRHGFCIAADECYSEIYPEESAPPLGALQAAHRLGREGFPRLVVFSSLSKRSSVPGLRSGFVAGDAALLSRFLAYRTYHGCALNPAVQAASIAAWGDETHVIENRRRYAAKFRSAVPALARALPVRAPEGGFYLWHRVPGGDDTGYARALFEATHVKVLPGSFLASGEGPANPGRGFVRVALVAAEDEVDEAVRRTLDFLGGAGAPRAAAAAVAGGPL